MSERDVAILRALRDRIDPGDAGAHNNLGVLFFQKGLYADAAAVFERALELDPRLDVARRNIRTAYRESGSFADRIRDLHATLQRDPEDVETRDALATTYLLGGDPSAAAREWSELLRAQPESTPLHMKLANAEAERGRSQVAVHLLEEATRLSPDMAAARLQLAELLFDTGMPVRAEREARRALSLDSDVARAHAFLARLLEETGRREEALEARERARQLDPDTVTPSAHLSLDRYSDPRRPLRELDARPEPVDDAGLAGAARADEFRREGDLQAAVDELERTIGAGEDSIDVRQALAELYLLRGEVQKAADAYAALVTERVDSPKLWNERGVSVHRLADLDEAIHAYRRTVALDHAYALGWNNLAVALAQQGLAGPAERAFRKAAAGPAPVELLWNLGLFLSGSDRPEEAVEVYRQAVDSDDSVAESWMRLGSALFQARDPAAARDALLEALERDPELAAARYQLGFALSQLGDFPGALRETQRALELEPILPTPQYQLLIDVQFEEGTIPAPEAGETTPVRAGSPVTGFEFEPGSLDRTFAGFRTPDTDVASAAELKALMDRARTALRRGQWQRAADAITEAVRAAPEALEPRLIEGQVLLQQGLGGEALERFDAVLNAGGADERQRRDAATGRAKALLQLDRNDEAITAARAAEAAGGRLALLGRALLAAGREREAIEAFEQAVDNGDVKPATLTGYGSALLGAGRPADARRMFTQSLRAGASAAAHVGLARSLHALGDTQGALDAYTEAAETLPSYAPGVLGLATAQWRAGRTQAAVRSLVDFLVLDPTHVPALVRLGVWLGDLGRDDQAVRSLRRALSIDPAHTEAQLELDRVTARKGGPSAD